MNLNGATLLIVATVDASKKVHLQGFDLSDITNVESIAI